MNVSEEHKQKAREIKIMIKRLDPEVLYCLADFMDFEGTSDDGMRSQCAYEAAELHDIYSTDGKPQKHFLDMGMNLGRVAVEFTFQKIDEETYETETFNVLSARGGE